MIISKILKLPSIVRNSYYMHKLLDLMEKQNYEVAVITSKKSTRFT